MKAFVKRMIWWFGFDIMQEAAMWRYYFSHGEPLVMETAAVLVLVAIQVVPLFFMKDDKEGNKR